MLGSGLRAVFRFQMLDVGGERLGTRDVYIMMIRQRALGCDTFSYNLLSACRGSFLCQRYFRIYDTHLQLTCILHFFQNRYFHTH